MAAGSNSGSIEVPMDAILSSAVAKVAEELLSELRPRIDSTEQASCSARRRVTAGGGLIAAVVVVAGYLAWVAYERDQEDQAEREKATAAQYQAITEQLSTAESSADAFDLRLSQQAHDIQEIKRAINQQTDSLNAAWREQLGKRAARRPRPFPDLVSGASPP